MENILITGATGNIGSAVIKFCFPEKLDQKIIAGVRDRERAKKKFPQYPSLNYTEFDFEKPDTFAQALDGIDCVFLLRPPELADVNRYFKPLVEMMVTKKVRRIIFLSVQGVEKSSIIPHHKIEKLIRDSGIEYIFLRPGYFMQNLTTTLLKDIQVRKEIFVPAGKAGFNWVDIENIGEIAAILFRRFEEFKNQPFDITGEEILDFKTVAEMLSKGIGREIKFSDPNPVKFYFAKRREGMAQGLIFVMIVLHFLPRFQERSRFSDFYAKLTGKVPTHLTAFIKREKAVFL